MSAEQIAAVGFVGGGLRVLRSPAGVTIADDAAGHTLRVDKARELSELLTRVLGDYEAGQAPRGLIGAVALATPSEKVHPNGPGDGRELYVKHTGPHVSIDELPHVGTGWTLRMTDQVIALRDALDRATGAHTTAQAA